MKATRIILTAALALCCGAAMAQDLLPAPQNMTVGKGAFNLDKPYKVVKDASADADNIYLSPIIQAKKDDAQPTIIIKSARNLDNQEAYALHITPDTLVITAGSRIGFIRAGQTIKQLLANGKRLQTCDIEDKPAYGWRGCMIDFSRHFFDADFVRKQIDILASFKINVMHLHITDSGGWRLAINRYPRLTEQGAWRTTSGWEQWRNEGSPFGKDGTPGTYGGYFTQEQMRSLVQYAADRGITMVPEIEMPAHSDEVTVAYPELACRQLNAAAAPDHALNYDICPGSEATYAFYENVLTEIMDIFPSKYIHVGGDEASKQSWKDCPLCQRKAKELGLPNTDGLQPYLIARIGRFLQQHGRKLIGWDEIINDSLTTNDAVMIWRDFNSSRDAIKRGCDVVLTPTSNCYMDYYQDAPETQPKAIGGYLPLEKVYSLNPESTLTPDEMQHVLGVQGNLWTEYIATNDYAEYMLYPRMLAIAEMGWDGTKTKNYDAFRQKAIRVEKQLGKQGIHVFDLTKEKGIAPQAPAK